VELALFGTIWLALAAFVAAEAGKRRQRNGASAGWTLWVGCAGALLCALHILLAFGLRHGWSHGAAIEDTARRTEAVFGLSWGGGLYVNYAFLALWIADLLAWRADRRPSAPLVWTVRAFYLLVLFNAAIVFSRPAARPFGAALIVALLWTWLGPAGGAADRR
jgi:hypothetical protein